MQPHSGSSANAAVFLALLKPGDKILGMDLSAGGHLTHGSPVNFSGKLYEAHSYSVNPETGLVDMEDVAQQARSVRPKLLIAGFLLILGCWIGSVSERLQMRWGPIC